MIGRRALRLYRISVPALLLAAPGLLAILGLGLAGLLAPAPAVLAALFMLLAAALVVGRFAVAVEKINNTIDKIAAEFPGQTASPPKRGITRSLDRARDAILRLARGWRERLDSAQLRLASAEAIVAAVPDPLILIDRHRRIVGANAAATNFVGSPIQSRDLAAVLRNPMVLMAADAMLRGEPARVVEFALTIPVERQLRARFARIERPSPEGAVALLTLHDVTELKRAEQMGADFVANASHELRTPLAALSGFIETLRGPAHDDREAGDRFLEIMSAQAARMGRLVEDLLSLSRIELNEHVPPRGRVALAPMLDHLVEALELRAGEHGMRIRLDLRCDLPDVQGDHDELAQLFQNLLDNAIKYARAGTEITVHAEPVTRAAGKAEQVAGSFVAVAVRDHGEGIAREHLPRLTERFYRIDTARSREMGGTGLGLAIVKHILNRHRGFLEIDSAVGEGSVFTVLLRPDSVAPPEGGPDGSS